MKIVLGIGAVVLLAACSNPPNYGTVVGKDYDPEYTYYTNQCFSYNQQGLCAVSVPMPNTQPEEYKLKLENNDKSGWITVDPQTYQNYSVGEQYP